MAQVVLKRSEMTKMVGLGYTTCYRLEKKGEFPARKQLSIGRVGWLRTEIEAWIDSRLIVA